MGAKKYFSRYYLTKKAVLSSRNGLLVMKLVLLSVFTAAGFWNPEWARFYFFLGVFGSAADFCAIRQAGLNLIFSLKT